MTRRNGCGTAVHALHGRTMSRQPNTSLSTRAAKVLAPLAVLSGAAFFLAAFGGLAVPTTGPIALELPISTATAAANDNGGDIPPAPTPESGLEFRPLQQPPTAVGVSPPIPAQQPTDAALGVALNEVFGVADNARVFSTPASAPESDWKLPPAARGVNLSDDDEEPPLPDRRSMRFETTLTVARQASGLVSPALQRAAADVARAFSVPLETAPIRPVHLAKAKPTSEPVLPQPNPSPSDSSRVSLLPPPLELPMPALDDDAPAVDQTTPANRPPVADQNVYDPYNIAPLPDASPESASPVATEAPGPMLPSASVRPAPTLAAMNPAELQSVMRLADEHSRRGFALGGRGVLYSARSEFMNALRLVAQALDAGAQTSVHVDSLTAGILALEESDDFIPRDGKINGGMNVASIIATHETPLLKDLTGDIPALIALQRYYNFAQQRLAASVQGHASGSLALHGLAKLYSVIGSRQPGSVVAPEPKAIVLEQAALIADPRNFMAANDLAVLLVRYGRTAEARTLLQNSVSSFGQPENWNNLADLHEQLGEKDLAQLARKAAKDAEQRLPQQRGLGAVSEAGAPQIEWVKPDAFRGVPDGALQQPNATAVKPPASGKQGQPFRRPAANEMWGTRKR